MAHSHGGEFKSDGADQRVPLSRSVEALHRETADVSEWLIQEAHRLVTGRVAD